MPAGLPRPSTQENVSTTISSGITDVSTTITVADASKFVSPCYLMIDRVDSAGVEKSTSLWELVKVTNISSNDLTVTRGQNGTTAQSHSAGAVIEAIVSSAMFEDWYSVLNPEHTSSGEHILATVTVTTHLNASGASLTGFPLVPVFAFSGSLSGATTFVQTPLVMPRTGRWSHVNVVTRTVASGVSAIVDINKNGTSVFDTVGRPMIAAGGTFVSTASIATKNFNRGDVFTWDYDGTGGHVTDFNIMLVSE